MNSKVVVSYELTLPQNIYPKLERLFNTFKWNVRRTISSLWNEETLEKLKAKGSSMGILKSFVKRPVSLPSRFHRNVLELSGEILRSQIERKRIYDYLIERPCRVLISENILAKELKTSPLFVLNVQRQVRNHLRKGKIEKDYFKQTEPFFKGNVVITSADDSVCKGQFRRLKVNGKFLEFEIKVPKGNKWEWIKVKKLLPDRLKKELPKAKRIASPLIKKVFLKSGYTIYRLVVPLEFKAETPKKIEKVFAIDLSPSEKRLGVGVIVTEKGHTKLTFFNAKRLTRKLERLLKEISLLERKIDLISDQIHSTKSKKHRQKLKQRLKHLFSEQKLRWRKFRELRKQVLEVFINLIIEHARAYNCEAIAIEDLSFKEPPPWKNPKMKRYFSTWFYAFFSERLKHKAKRHGIKVIEVSPAYTSLVCHKCGKKGKADHLNFTCNLCGSFDRDYNASVNIGLRALKMASKSKSKPYMGKDIPARVPFLQGLARFKALIATVPLTKLISYLKLVKTSYLKAQNLLKYTCSDKYG